MEKKINELIKSLFKNNENVYLEDDIVILNDSLNIYMNLFRSDYQIEIYSNNPFVENNIKNILHETQNFKFKNNSLVADLKNIGNEEFVEDIKQITSYINKAVDKINNTLNNSITSNEIDDEEEKTDEKLKIVYKEVGKDPVVMEIDDTLEAKQKLVGGLIEVVPYKDNLLLICNEEGKITNLKPNLQFDYDYIAGNCFVVGDDFENGGFKSVEETQIEDIKKDLEDRTIILEEIKDELDFEEEEF